MKLLDGHLDPLRVVDELETVGRLPGTRAVGARLLEIWTERGGPYFWKATSP